MQRLKILIKAELDMDFLKAFGEKTSLESIIFLLFVTTVTLIGVVVTMWFRIRKISQGEKANKIAGEALRVTLNDSKPSVSLAVRIIDKPKIPLEQNASFSVEMTASNAGERNVVFEQVTAYVELRKSDGSFSQSLGDHRMLKEEKPVVEPAKKITRMIQLVVGNTAEPRVKLKLKAAVRVGNNPIEIIESDFLTDYIY